MIAPPAANEEKAIRLIDDTVSGERIVGIFAQRKDVKESPPANIFELGRADEEVKGNLKFDLADHIDKVLKETLLAATRAGR